MVRYEVKDVSSSLSFYNGLEIDLTIIPDRMDSTISMLHDACTKALPIYILTHKEMEELLEAKHRLEGLEW